MAAITRGEATQVNLFTLALRSLAVVLTLATASIHASLGGMMFMANAAGYTVLAIALVAPGPTAGYRWLIRLALLGFTAATIAGWVAFGARFDLAYLDKALEVALIGVLLIEQWQSDGGPVGVVRRLRRLVGGVTAATVARIAR